MEKPTPMMAFEAMYRIAAAGGREEALFGSCRGPVLEAYRRTLIGGGYPSAYLEFPLLGDPGLDLLSVHGEVEPGARFAPGAGYGYQAMFDWFSGIGPAAGGGGQVASCGLELDLSAGEAERAGAYLQQRGRTGLVGPFLASVGEGERAQGYLDVLARMPEGWPPAYVGLFPGRPGTPLRIGGYLDGRELGRCREGAPHLSACFDRIGFSAYDAPHARALRGVHAQLRRRWTSSSTSWPTAAWVIPSACRCPSTRPGRARRRHAWSVATGHS